MSDNVLYDEHTLIHLFHTTPKDIGIITSISLMRKLRLRGWSGDSQLARGREGLKPRAARCQSGLFLHPPCLTHPALTSLHVQARAGLGWASTLQSPGLSAPIPCQPPLPPSLEEEVHQCLGALQGTLLPRGPRLLLLPLLLLLCRHEGASGRAGGVGRREGQGAGVWGGAERRENRGQTGSAARWGGGVLL